MFSVFRTKNINEPFETLNLQGLHSQIINPDREPFRKAAEAVDRLRQSTNEAEQNMIKSTLPAFTPGAMLDTKRAEATPEQKNIVYSGFMQIDIDAKDNPNMKDPAAVRALLSQVPYIALAAISTRGKGVWGLIALQEPDKFKAYSYQVYDYFRRARVTLDKSKGKNVTELRFYSPDPGAILKSDYLLLPLLPPHPQPPQATGHKPTGSTLTELKKWVTDTTGYIFEEGKHNFIFWLSYALRKNGTSETDVYSTIYDHVLSKEYIHTNCISGGIAHANDKGHYTPPPPERRPQQSPTHYSAKATTPDYITAFI